MTTRRKPRLGQNFLIDEAACARIAEALGDVRERTVVEIGPGHGAITALLAERCRELHAVEFDAALARELSFRFRNAPQVAIHHADILKTDVAALVEPLPFAPESGDARFDVLGNLPYYITSEILLHLYNTAREGVVRRAVVMMQREVADRLAAQPGHSAYGALSAWTRMHASVTELFTLPPQAFDPAPEVYSTVVRLEFAPRFTALGVDPEGFNRFLRASFAQKRKTLANNLRVAGYAAERLHAAWPASLPVQIRAEALDLETMATLYRSLTVPTTPSGSGTPDS